MGCGSSNAVAAEASKNDADKPVDSQQMPKKVYPPAEAFEIPIDDNAAASEAAGDGSIIKRHPPKRLLQRLTEPTSNQTPTTIEDLEEKLANAEVRRNKFLQQRVDRIKEAGDDTESTENDADDNEADDDETVRQRRNKRNAARMANALETPALLEAANAEHQIADEVEPTLPHVPPG